MSNTLIQAAQLQPGMVVTSTSKKGSQPPTYLIIDVQRTPESRVKAWVHILGHPKPLTFPIFLQPSMHYILNDSPVIEESPV